MSEYGKFDDDRREYVITTPHTPRPWINYLGSEDYFGIISNHGGGYTFYRDARMRRITRFRYNNVPEGVGGRYYYLVDGDEVWTPTWGPTFGRLDDYRCRHGLGYTIFEGSRAGLRAELLCFVPRGVDAEVHRLRLTNDSDAPKRVRLHSLIEWCLWDALDDMSNFQRNLSTGEVEVDGSTIYHVTEYRERRNHYAFFHGPPDLLGFETDRAAFLGPYRGFHRPVALTQPPTNSIASGWSPIASHALEVTLAPGQSKVLCFVLGYVENPPEQKWDEGTVDKRRARAIIERFQSSEQVDLAMEELAEHWSRRLANYQVSSRDPRLNRMVNIWNPAQCMTTFNLSRSASFFESGVGRGMGFRDSNQDLLGVMHIEPERARQRLLDIAATQFDDGSAYHQYQPLTKRGNHDIGSGFNDDPLWLILAVCAYCRETGDYDLLDEMVPFDHDDEKAGTMLDHCRRSFGHVLENIGPHGLPLIGRADWNDCLNLNCFSTTPGESFQTTENREGRVAESVMIAGMFVAIGRELAELFDHLGLDGEASTTREHIARMEETVLREGWDGAWFLRAYDANSQPVGSAQNEEGQIFIESQGWCVMAGIGIDSGHARQALDSVSERLATPYGIVLHQPAYQRYHEELGEISSYPPGYKENAGIFCHNNPWIMIAETKLRRGQRAFDYYRRIAPAYVASERTEVHQAEPYVYAQMIAGRDAPREGEAKNSWLTGTAAYNFVAIAEHILGVRPEHDGLRIDPCLPGDLGPMTLERRCRGATYRIEIDEPGAGPFELVVDGNPVRGNVVAFAERGREVHVICRPRREQT